MAGDLAQVQGFWVAVTVEQAQIQHFVHGKPIDSHLGIDLDMSNGIKTLFPWAASAGCHFYSIKQFKIQFLAPFMVTGPHRPPNPWVLPNLSYWKWSGKF